MNQYPQIARPSELHTHARTSGYPRSPGRARNIVLAAVLLIIATVAVATLILTLPGCAAPATVDANSDPVLVNAERTYQASFETINQFLVYDDENRSLLATSLPAVHGFAESLRTDHKASRALNTLRDAISLYRTTRTASSGSALSDQLAVVTSLVDSARRYLLEIETKRQQDPVLALPPTSTASTSAAAKVR